MSADVTLERSMPCNLDAERAVLGAVLLDERAIYAASEVAQPDDFYLESHRTTYATMLRLIEESRSIDFTTLREELQHHDELERAGGTAYLCALTEGLPRALNVRHYAEIVREKASLRRMIAAGNNLMAHAYQAEDKPSAILETHESEIFRIAAREVKGGFRSAEELVSVAYREIEEASNRKTLVTGLETGFTELDRMTGGLSPADLVIVAARPSLGKTSLCLNIACHAGIRCGKCVAVFSLETAAVQLTKLRMLCAEGEVDAHKAKSGFLNREDWTRIGRAAGAISQARIWIDDASNTMMQIRAKAHRLWMEHGLDLVIIDYLQLMSGTGEKQRENRTQEVTAISRGCKQLAKELDVPVIAISQLSRAPEHGGKSRRPQLSDLRESGAIEQDADLVLFIWREEIVNPTDDNSGVAEIIVGKNRNGATGSFQLAFIKQYTKFANLWHEAEQSSLYSG